MIFLHKYYFIVLLVFFICSLVFSLLINGLFLKFAKSLGIRNTEDTIIRWGSQSKPAFGGISFFILFLFSIIANSFLFDQNNSILNIKSVGFILASTLGFLLGLFDDAYNTHPRLKLFAQILCGIILISTGTYIHIFLFMPFNYAITIFWIVGLMNSINMLDNMDAIVTVVSVFILVTIGVNFILKDIVIISDSFIIVGVMAALLGFLAYNWHPSKMYMGDTGSQFLGVFLAVIGINYLWNGKDFNGHEIFSKQFLSAILIFILPLVDTTTVVIKRISKGNSPFIGGKDHTTHHLSYLLLSDRKVVYVFSGISVVSSLMAIWIIDFAASWNYFHILFFSVYIFIIFSVLFYIANIHKVSEK